MSTAQGPVAISYQKARDPKREVIVKCNAEFVWYVEFCDNSDWNNTLRYGSQDRPLKGKLEMAFELDGLNRELRFRDGLCVPTVNPKKNKVAEARCRAVITIPLANCARHLSTPTKEGDWVIKVELSQGKAFKPEVAFEPPFAAFPQHDVTEQDMRLCSRRARLAQLRYMRFTLKQYKNVKLWNSSLVQEIFAGKLERTFEQKCQSFIDMQKAAIEAEDKGVKNLLEGLARDRIEVEIVADPNQLLNPSVFVRSIKSGVWKLQQGLIVRFESKDFVAWDAPPLHDPTSEDKGGWQIGINRQDGQRWQGTFKNRLTAADVRKLVGRKFNDVKATTVSCNDDETGKLLGAIKLLDLRIKIEFGFSIDPNRFPSEVVDRMKDIKIPVAKKILKEYGKDFGTTSKKPLRFRNPSQTRFDVSMFPSNRPIEDARQLDFLQNVVDNELTVCQGPPGTGKTTINSSLVNLLLGQTDGGNIILTAHSNTAVEVLVDRTAFLMRHFFNKSPADHICLIRTQASTLRIAASGRPVLANLESLFLDSHVDRFWAADNTKLGIDYRRARKELKATGHLYDIALKKQFAEAQSIAYKNIRSRIRIWGCTMSASTHRILTGPKERPFDANCDVLIMDEASQATTPYEVLSWLNLNPARLVVVGDHKQLSPHTKTKPAQTAWDQSWLQELIDRKPEGLVRLNTQYRHPFEIGNSLSQTFYNGDVKPHPSCHRPEVVAHFAKIMARISCRDAAGVTHQLSHHVHFFNIVNSQCVTGAEDTSSYNIAEADFVTGLIKALVEAGANPAGIMTLTGYEAQQIRIIDGLKGTPVTTIRKIDSSQGDESDLVVLSIVRTDEKPGFLSRPH